MFYWGHPRFRSIVEEEKREGNGIFLIPRQEFLIYTNPLQKDESSSFASLDFSLDIEHKPVSFPKSVSGSKFRPSWTKENGEFF